MQNSSIQNSKFGLEDSQLKERIKKKLLWYETKNLYSPNASPAKNYLPKEQQNYPGQELKQLQRENKNKHYFFESNGVPLAATLDQTSEAKNRIHRLFATGQHREEKEEPKNPNAISNQMLPDDLFTSKSQLWPKSSLSKHYKFYPSQSVFNPPQLKQMAAMPELLHAYKMNNIERKVFFSGQVYSWQNRRFRECFLNGSDEELWRSVKNYYENKYGPQADNNQLNEPPKMNVNYGKFLKENYKPQPSPQRNASLETKTQSNHLPLLPRINYRSGNYKALAF